MEASFLIERDSEVRSWMMTAHFGQLLIRPNIQMDTMLGHIKDIVQSKVVEQTRSMSASAMK
jgi:hypothetical protein